jgi:hypothetical protein
MESTQIEVTAPVTASATPDVTPAQALRAAARYLELHGWIQGAYYEPTATMFTPAACVVGAIGMVCYGGPVDAPAQRFDDPGFPDFESAVAYLDLYLVWRLRSNVTVYDFNDTLGREYEDVIALLHDAADEWDRRNSGGAQ